MSPNPVAFLEHLRTAGYHPRSDKHSNALAEAIVRDLVERCPVMRGRAGAGELVYDLNFTITAGTSDWKVDLVLGTPPPGVAPPSAAGTIVRTAPATVEVAIEIKTVMTEHRKAVKNRKRDFEAHHEHVHRYDGQAIAGGVLVVNQAATFRSPLRPRATEHRQPAELVRHCIEQMRAVATRNDLANQGLEAMAVVVVRMDNNDLQSTSYVIGPPAPAVGDPLHYDSFIQRLCRVYAGRARLSL